MWGGQGYYSAYKSGKALIWGNDGEIDLVHFEVVILGIL